MASKKIFGIVLAGGEGKRLMPLTADRAKPAVPFGGQYRLIDFALSNLINSGLTQIVVLTQYKSHSLDRHVSQTWRLNQMLNSYIASVPRSSGSASAGSAARRTRSCRASTSSTTRSPTSSSWSARTTSTAWTSAR
ncbi:Glucose-1-phosphate adenylyltransferase [Clavibacter michiganensis subsp. michiganensis]|uniref:Glucose-1-phosphate adenylyltransferase n=1 Tax=Clavibacter michiganensis subsp. michiganensis TaxID=33013 RepID=A0A251XI93_CLAMM|nr:Glucose-1-phosphate adenylyltransferase [Clavibacter michiganensis subsp. michiganensis]OUE02815.1 Glucose-1-phosphate adenylyltransferase [Clavibacter michiganensis subsp. michiganensis]